MAEKENTFKALLSQAPLFQKAETVTLTGSLARSTEADKFALMQSDGSVLMLDIDAVKSHTVIANSFGHSIVQIELAAERMPKGEAGQGQVANPSIAIGMGTPPGRDELHTGIGDQKHPWLEHKVPWFDQQKYVVSDQSRSLYALGPQTYADGADVVHTFPGYDHQPSPQPGSTSSSSGTGVTTKPNYPGGYDYPYPTPGSFPGWHDIPTPLAACSPFIMATGHQAPANAIDQL